MNLTTITQAIVGQTQAQQGSPMGGFVMLAIMFAIFYFLLIRPQQKKMKEHQIMLGNLQRGDNVVTAGGVFGRITAIADDVVTLQIADNVKIKVQKSAVQAVVGAENE